MGRWYHLTSNGYLKSTIAMETHIGRECEVTREQH